MDRTLSKLAELLLRHGKEEGANKTAIPSLTIFRSSTVTPPLRTVYDPALFIIARGAKDVMAGERALRYDPRTCLVSTASLPVSGKVVEAPFLSVRIDFDLELIFQLLQQSPPAAVSKTASLALSVEVPGEPLLEAVLRFVALLEAPEEIPVLMPLYYKEILFRLLVTGHGPRFRQLAQEESSAYRVSRAIGMMRKDLFEPWSVDRLAQAVEMGVSSFHKHFKAVTGTSPLQYLKAQRLQEAKRRICLEKMEISQAAFSVGYESPSQFSREYAKYFGLSPSLDRKYSERV